MYIFFCNKPQIYELLVPVLHCTVCQRPRLSKVHGGLQICDVQVRISSQREFYLGLCRRDGNFLKARQEAKLG